MKNDLHHCGFEYQYVQALHLGYMKLKFNEVDAYINIKQIINKDIIFKIK